MGPDVRTVLFFHTTAGVLPGADGQLASPSPRLQPWPQLPLFAAVAGGSAAPALPAAGLAQSEVRLLLTLSVF